MNKKLLKRYTKHLKQNWLELIEGRLICNGGQWVSNGTDSPYAACKIRQFRSFLFYCCSLSENRTHDIPPSERWSFHLSYQSTQSSNQAYFMGKLLAACNNCPSASGYTDYPATVTAHRPVTFNYYQFQCAVVEQSCPAGYALRWVIQRQL